MVNYKGKDAYVSAQYVEVELLIDEGETNEEIKEREVREAEEKAKLSYNAGAFAATADETKLLAALIHCEAGGESYEGQLAVANVILNRVRDPRFGNTVADVVYAAGQFPGAHNGALANVLANGPSASCMQAAREALAGVNNIGDYYYFNGYVDTSCVSSYTVIGGHTFYNY